MIEEEYKNEYYRVSANIDLDAIRYNVIEEKKKLKPGAGIMAVIKADAYGHGAVPVSRAIKNEADWYGVAIPDEAVQLRKCGIEKPILILGPVDESQIKLLINYNITLTVFSLEFAKRISGEAKESGKCADIHIKIDTGMGRIGYQPEQRSIDEIVEISRLPYINLGGMFTHFAKADETDKSFVKLQLERMNYVIGELKKKGISIPVIHAANSAGIIELPETHFNMVRSGIATYGLYPSDEVDHNAVNLKPALELKTHISHIKQVGAGFSVGYGGTYITDSDRVIATVPVGYADGYPRMLSNKGRVLVNGKSAPIVGRICMDQFMIDVTDIDNVKVGDVVTLVGRDKDAFIPVEEPAELAGSFNYEFICNISKRVPRVYYTEGRPYLVRKDMEIL